MKLSPFKLERYFAKYEFRVEYSLCSSDCESMSIQDLLAFEPVAPDKFQRHWLGYTESEGSPSLRAEISKIYSTLQPENILVHSGAEEAIFLFMHAVLSPGDHIIVHNPCYQSLFEVARSIGCKVTLWQTDEPGKWRLNPADLKNLIRQNTKAVVINTPHNPTGYLMSPETFLEINRVTQESGITLFSDEVYRESEYQIEDRLPAAGDINPKAVSLGVMSKTYGLAGLRIGWIATSNTDIYAKMAALKDYTTICNSAPSEFLAELALHHREKLIQRNVEIIKHNLALLDEFFSRYDRYFVWQKPQAGPIAFPRLVGLEVDAFCDALLKTSGVLLLPGTIYGDRENHFRIGFGRKNMPAAISRLEKHLTVQTG